MKNDFLRTTYIRFLSSDLFSKSSKYYGLLKLKNKRELFIYNTIKYLLPVGVPKMTQKTVISMLL